jgi:hypothetical protein
MKPGEFYFVLDRSEPFKRSANSIAKNALILFLRSIPPGSRFNVISFGSKFERMFSEPTDYSQETLEYAIDQIQEFNADLGEADIYQPLEDIFSNAAISTDLDKHVFLIVNGDVSDPKKVIDLIRANNEHFTLHSFEIDNEQGKTQISEFANAGNGQHYFVNKEAEGLHEKIIEALNLSFKPYLKFSQQNIEFKGSKCLEYPKANNLRSKLLSGDLITYCAIVNELPEDQLKGSVSFSFWKSDNGKNEDVVINVDESLRLIEGDSIFKLIANYYLNNKRNERSKEYIVKASMKYQVPSMQTSFITVEQSEGGSSKKISSEGGFSEIDIFIMTLTGKVISIRCRHSDAIEDIKYIINSVEGIPIPQINLIFKGKRLENSHSLKSYSIQVRSLLHIVITGCFGPNIFLTDKVTGAIYPLRVSFTNSRIFELMMEARQQLKSHQFKLYYEGKEMVAKPGEKLADVGIKFKEKLEVGYDSFKDFTDLQKCEGDWTEDVMQLVKITLDDVIEAISTEIKNKFSNEEDQLSIMFTWIGVKALHELYPESENKWRLIALKGIEALSRKGMIYNQMEFASLSFAQ